MRKSILRSLFSDTSEEAGDRTKFIRKRVQIVEKHIPALNSALSEYVNKSSGIVDCNYKIASILENYAEAESVTTGIKQNLADFANILYEIGGKRINSIQSMETNILRELREYVKLCKNVHTELKCSIIAYDRERIRMRQLRRAQDHPQDQLQISMAQAELIKARNESCKSSKSLEEQIDIFERRRLSGLRSALLSWTLAELAYHAKALELFTDAYNIAAKINVDTDLEEFRSKLTMENPLGLDSSRESTGFQRNESIMQLLSIPFQRNGEKLTGVGIPHPSSSSTPTSAMNSSEVQQSSIF